MLPHVAAERDAAAVLGAADLAGVRPLRHDDVGSSSADLGEEEERSGLNLKRSNCLRSAGRCRA